MGKGKRQRFIEKKDAQTFKLVHRSQRDPLIADADASERVLAPLDDRAACSSREPASDSAARRVEQAKFGIDFDDDYNYLQHLRDTGETVHVAVSEEPILERYRIRPDGTVETGLKEDAASLQLPQSLFETPGVQLRVGLLNQAAPQPGPHPELDPDIVAALDEPDQFAGDIEDDFVRLANARGDHTDSDSNDDSDGEGDDEFGSDFGEEHDFAMEETRTRFTEYSMSSSVLPRSENLQTLDARFEKLYEQYDEEEMGDLPLAMDDQLAGFIEPDSMRVMQLLQQYEKKQNEKKELLYNALEGDDRAEKTVRVYSDDSDTEPEPHPADVADDDDKQWDCESILATYSNLYNRPAVIGDESSANRKRPVKLDARGVPTTAVDAGLTKHKLKKLNLAPDCDQMDVDQASRVSVVSSARPKDETGEQRRERKHIIKAMRRERRVEKKQNKTSFKQEMITQRKQAVAQQKHVTVIQ